MASKNSSGGGIGVLMEMWQEIQLAWRLFRDPLVSWHLKIIPALGLAYVISPVDLIIDVIPVIGQMDDIAVMAFCIKTFVDLAPQDRVAYHRAALGGETPPASDQDRTIDGRYKG